jgi:methionine-rich copper-binding protein CopC
MKRTGWLTVLLGALLVMGWPLVSLAHVHMERSVPADGAHLQQAPKLVQLWFTGSVAAEWSKIMVTDARGERVDSGEVSDAGDPKHLGVGLKRLVPGVYEVRLNVVSGDGHRVKGSFSFTVE